MSHNVYIEGVQFANLEVLELAIAELRKEGVDCMLVKEPTKIRGWMGRTSNVHAAIMMPNEQYDIGLNRNADGVYVPIMEDLARFDGLQAQGDPLTNTAIANRMAAKLGRLSQRYAVIHTERNARANNISTRRVSNTKGHIQLIATHR